ncbi:MAG: lipoyl(octanoyl) transferase LipB [Bdellovibrionales bacterium]
MENHYLSHPPTKEFFHKEFFGKGWLFPEGFQKQLESIDKVLKDEREVHLLSGAHAPVFTLGNSLKKDENLKGDFVQTDRGGKVMYHGPGQLTIYPIFKLQRYFNGPKAYIKFLFDLAIDHFKKTYSIDLHCKNNGLWTEERKKVGFVGLRVKKGVTYHGLSLNYDVDLGSFLKHSPCDISGEQAGNIFNEDAPCLKEESEILMNLFFERLTLRDA